VVHRLQQVQANTCTGFQFIAMASDACTILYASSSTSHAIRHHARQVRWYSESISAHERASFNLNSSPCLNSYYYHVIHLVLFYHFCLSVRPSLCVCLARCGILYLKSKRIHDIVKLFRHHLSFLSPRRRYKIPKGTPSA